MIGYIDIDEKTRNEIIDMCSREKNEDLNDTLVFVDDNQ